MTDPMTTTTAQATVLTEEQLANIESTLDTYVQHHRKVDTEWARTMAMNVVRSHRALTEQVRVLREAMAAIVAEATPTDYPDNNVTVYTILDEYIDDARSALAALEGSGESE